MGIARQVPPRRRRPRRRAPAPRRRSARRLARWPATARETLRRSCGRSWRPPSSAWRTSCTPSPALAALHRPHSAVATGGGWGHCGCWTLSTTRLGCTLNVSSTPRKVAVMAKGHSFPPDSAAPDRLAGLRGLRRRRPRPAALRGGGGGEAAGPGLAARGGPPPRLLAEGNRLNLTGWPFPSCSLRVEKHWPFLPPPTMRPSPDGGLCG